MNPNNPLYRQQEAPPVRRKDALVNPSLLILFVAAILTFPAGLAVWQERTLGNEEGFIEVGNDVLREEAVQKELARGLTEDLNILPDTSGSPLGQILGGSSPELGSLLDRLGGALGRNTAVGGDTAAAEPAQPSFMESIALRLLASSPGTPPANAALSLTRDEVLRAIRSDTLTAEDESIVLNLGDTIRELLPTGGAIVASMLPPDVGTIEVLNSADLTLDFRLARLFDGRAILWLLLPIAVFAAGFFVAPNWARYCFQAGVALAVSAGVWIIYVKFIHKPRVVDDAIHDERTRDAANAAYDVITGPFIQQELMVIVAGLVLAAAGFALSKRGSLAVREQAR